MYLLSLRYQIAQKIHACTDPLDGQRVNSRARDLVDLQILGQLMKPDDLPSVRRACVEIFEGRCGHAWPPDVVVPEAWPKIYAAACEGISDVAFSVEDAATWLSQYIVQIDDAE